MRDSFRPAVVACLDIGSPKDGKVGWAVLHGSLQQTGRDLDGFVQALTQHLTAKRSIALGFECPLYVPKRPDVSVMTESRPGEVGLYWSGGPGPSVLTIGLVQVNWVLTEVAKRSPLAKGTTRWSEFSGSDFQLFLWEAYITSKSGVEVSFDLGDSLSSHEADALCGALAFQRVVVRDGIFPSDLRHEPALSLIGLHLVETGLSSDQSLLSESCAVVKVRKPT